MEENQFEKDRLAKLLTVGLISGVIAAGINICYMYFYESLTGFSYPQYINFLTVAISSIVPSVFAGLLYFSLRRMFKPSKAFSGFLIIMMVVMFISFLGPLNNELPNGKPMPAEFAGLSIPMHIFAPVIYVFMLVRAVPRK